MMRVQLFTVVMALYIGLANSVISPADLKANVKFNLFTRSNPRSLVRIRIGDAVNANFKAGRPSKFIVHGFTESANVEWLLTMKDRYLQTQDVNVFAVGWEKYASFFGTYYSARVNTKDVGGYLGQFIAFLETSWKIKFDTDVHCVGFSLGAHVCGYAGKKLYSTVNKQMHRISGLDPAGIYFSASHETERLTATDAVFVDAFHTDSNGLGFLPRVADVDIYANGGDASQPGCFLQDILLFGDCSHFRACEYFIESIAPIASTSKKFVATNCNDTWLNTDRTSTCMGGAKIIVGDPIDKNLTGIFYLPTASQSPFALG